METTEDYWNLTEPSNATWLTEEPIEKWRVILGNVATVDSIVSSILLMLGMGTSINVKELWHHCKRPLGPVIGMVGQFLVMPALGFTVSYLFKLTPYEAMGTLIITCSPGGTLSNFFTFWSEGDLALSVVMTTFSSILAFCGMPFNLWLYSRFWLTDGNQRVTVPYRNIMVSLAFIMGPVAVGIVIRHFHQRSAEIITKVTSWWLWFGITSATVLLFITHWNKFDSASGPIFLSIIILLVIGFTLAYGMAVIMRQTHKVARTVGIETSFQNMPVAVSVVVLSFSDLQVRAQVVLFPLIYGLMQFLLGMMLVGSFRLYRRKCGKGGGDPTETGEGTAAETESLKN